MSDNLKQFVDRDPQKFEIYDFDAELGWSTVEANLEPVGQPSVGRWWMGSAAIVALLVAGMIGYGLALARTDYPDELVEAQSYYQGQIDAKMMLVKDRLPSDELLNDLAAMDVAFNELREDLHDDVHNQEVVTAMIDNYRLRLTILERILEDLSDEKNNEKRNI